MKPDLKVLVVDDESINLNILEAMIGNQCRLKMVSSGEEALSDVISFAPDIVLLDVMMPGIDGYETCKKLREKSDLKDLKIIMISAKRHQEDIEEGFKSGADEYLLKPFDEDILVDAINRNIN